MTDTPPDDQPKKRTRGPDKKKRATQRRNKVVYVDRKGLPIPEPPRTKNIDGNRPMPNTEGKPYLETEKSLAQVEILLLKGVTTASTVAATLGVHPDTAKKYIEQIHYRWAALGQRSRIVQVKGEAKARLDLITNELWVLFSNSNSESVKGSCLSKLLEVHDRKLVIEGLTPKMIESLKDQTPDPNGGMMVSERISRHNEMLRLGHSLMKYVSEYNGEPIPIEGETVSDDTD